MEQYVGEIRMFAGNYAPTGWALCNGQIISIAENELLFALIGTIYGGDGQTTFALPDLRGRVPVHTGQNPQTQTVYNLGAKGGVETVQLTSSQLAAHTHTVKASATLTTNVPTGALWAKGGANRFSTVAPDGTMNATLVSSIGGNQPHDNMMPYVPINFIIAVEGLFPSQP
ncbi:phage tail protein [Brevibacillus dissolubilis]|uniref:phage tail protein n=1 Tax=Brevibacillus dissolubilis TaxID=1844116 RepID=UPI001116BE26|nr:tail fiber protein [Brevibacillus dissolubilis]